MSQHPFTIPNQLAPAARADINDALKALASTNSGATAPATTYANQFWYDTSTDLLKIRNEANSAWITLGAVDQTTGKFDPNLTIATNAEAIGGTENTHLMTALRVREATDSRLNVTGTAPLYACRAWVNFSGGDGAIRAGGNVASVARLSAGDYLITFTTPMIDANYTFSAGLSANHGQGGATESARVNAITSTAIRIQTGWSNPASGALFDPTYVMLQFFR